MGTNARAGELRDVPNNQTQSRKSNRAHRTHPVAGRVTVRLSQFSCRAVSPQGVRGMSVDCQSIVRGTVRTVSAKSGVYPSDESSTKGLRCGGGGMPGA